MSREGALAEYEVAQKNMKFRLQALKIAREEYTKALRAEAQARYLAIISVPCPFCQAEIDTPCYLHSAKQERSLLSSAAQHGVRQDLSGVNGEPSRQRQLKLMKAEAGA